jgi:hypothetical protein
MADDGVFIDIFSRLNLQSVDRVLADVKAAMRRGGTEAGRDFSAGFDTSFKEITAASDRAFRQMQTGMAELQRAEAQINEMRVNSYRHTADAMIAAQQQVDAALAHTADLIAATTKAQAAERDAVMAPGGRSRGPRGRDDVIPLSRGANRVGIGATLATAGGVAESARIAVDVQGQLNRVQAQQHETGSNIALLTQSVWQIAQRSGIKPQEIAGAYPNVERATNYVTGQGYRGPDAVDVMQNAAMLTRTAPGTSLEEAIQAITTTSHDYRIKVKDAAALLSAGAAGVKGSMDDFASSLHSIEPAAQMAGIQPTEIIAAMQQMSQTGQTSQQSAPNLTRLLQSLTRPNTAAAKRMSQLGINPEDISTNLKNRGLADTLQGIQQKIATAMGPDGNIKLGFAYQNQLEQQQQDDDFAHLSPQLQRLVSSSPEFQNSEISGSPKLLKKALDKAGVDATDTDVPIVADWLKKQKDLHGPNSNIRSNAPDVMNALGAYTGVFGTQDAARTAMMLAGSPQLIQQYQGREQDLTKQGTPDAFTSAFRQAMDSDQAKFQKLGASAEALAGKMGDHLLPILTTVVDDLNGFIDYLDRNKIAMDAFVTTVGGIATLWAGAKAINIGAEIAKAFGPVVNGALGLAGKLSGVNMNVLTNPMATAGGAIETGAATAAGTLEADAAVAGTSLETGAATAGTEIQAAGAAAAERLAAGAVPVPGAVPGKAGGALGKIAPLAGPAYLSYLAGQNLQQYQKDHPDSPQNPILQQFEGTPLYRQLQGKAHGGIAGYQYGGKTANPYSQGLMSVPDTGSDSVLGLLPGGMPIGLRGGEGILTPEATQAIGGKDAVDSINANPWNNPFKVATTFYGSFSKGVAKYSPWGKYLEASSQSLDSLEQEFDKTTDIHRGGKVKGSAYQKAMAYYQQTGQWPQTDSGAPKGKSGVVAAVKQAYLAAGFPASQWKDVEHIISHESGWNPSARNPSSGAFGLGQFLGHENDRYGAEGAYSNDPSQQAGAMMAYVKDVYGDPAHAWAHWQANHSYATGGVVGYAPGGVVQPPPGPGVSSIAPLDQPDKSPAKAPVNPTVKPPVQPSRQPSPPKTPPKPPAHNTSGKPSPRLSPQGDKPGTAPRASGDRNIKANPSRAGGQENTSKGFGIGGGLIGSAEGAASMAAGAVTGGAGGQAASSAFSLINRAIGYGGQLVGIGLEGLLETFTLNDSKLGDPTNSLFGKVALGIAGAHPSPSNSAGMAAKQFNPKQDLDAGAMAGKQVIPQIHMENVTNNHYGNEPDYSKWQVEIAKALHGTGGIQNQGNT